MAQPASDSRAAGIAKDCGCATAGLPSSREKRARSERCDLVFFFLLHFVGFKLLPVDFIREIRE